MSRQSDPVPALDRAHLLFQILYDDYLTAFLVGESGQTEGIHENLRQSTVKTSPDSMQLLQAFLRKRVPQILRHDPITVTQQAQRTENGRFHHVIAKPIRQNGEKLTENPEAFQSDPSPKPRFGLFCLSTSGLLIRFRFYEQFHIIDLRADRKPLAQLLPVYLALEILRRNDTD